MIGFQRHCRYLKVTFYVHFTPFSENLATSLNFTTSTMMSVPVM